MKYVKFTYIDRLTGKSVAVEPASNGPVFPAIPGLEFEWARESQYPTNVPEFFGTCTEVAKVEGFLAELSQYDYENMKADEMQARSTVPSSITMRQARLYLLKAGKLADVEAAINALPSPQKEAATIEWQYSQEVQRHNGFVELLAPVLGWTPEEVDAMFVEAAKL